MGLGFRTPAHGAWVRGTVEPSPGWNAGRGTSGGEARTSSGRCWLLRRPLGGLLSREVPAAGHEAPGLCREVGGCVETEVRSLRRCDCSQG